MRAEFTSDGQPKEGDIMARKKEGGNKLVEVGVQRGVKRKTIQRSLRCELTNEEQRTKGLEMAEEIGLARKAEEEKASVTKTLKEEIEMHLGRASSLALELRQGYVTRPVECEQVFDYKEGKVLVRRKDDKSTIEERAMTEEERQVSFFEEEEVALANEKDAAEGAAGADV
jgi:hypothetical protein